MKKITIFTLGGTIAMQEQIGGACPALNGCDLVGSLDIDPDAVHVSVEALMNVPSGHLTMADVYALSARIDKILATGADGIVVIQGTDTIEEVAFALDLLHSGRPPIVLTGAMRLASSISADGPGNIRRAVQVAADPTSRDRGALVVFNDTIHAARQVVKTHAVRVDTFQSRDGGLLGLVMDGRIDWYGDRDRSRGAALALPKEARSRVPLLKSYLGDDGTVIDALFNAEIHGLVIEGLGGGHLHPNGADKIEVLARHLPILLTTRCQSGPALIDTYGYVGGEIDLIKRGLIPCRNLSGVKARVALTILLDAGVAIETIRDFFQQ